MSFEGLVRRVLLGLILLAAIFGGRAFLWDHKTFASYQGLGALFTTSNGSNWTATIGYTGSGPFTPGESLSAVFSAYHCNSASPSPCAPDLTPEDFASTLTNQNFSLTVPNIGPGGEYQLGFSHSNPGCGRIQVDIGLNDFSDAIVGGTVFNFGSSCPLERAAACPVMSCEYSEVAAECPSGARIVTGTAASGFNQPGCTFIAGCSEISCAPPAPAERECPAGFERRFVQGIWTCWPIEVSPSVPPAAPVVSAPVCPYSSTQARVQKDLSDSWDNFKVIESGQQIRVGGFHNFTGVLAGDVRLDVTGPQLFSNTGNGSFITPTAPGDYTLTVTTFGFGDSSCTGFATFRVLGQPIGAPVVGPIITQPIIAIPRTTVSLMPPTIRTPQQQQTQTQQVTINQPTTTTAAQPQPSGQEGPQVLTAAAPQVLPRTGVGSLVGLPIAAGLWFIGKKLRKNFKLV